jgi:hypothetical protein
MKEYTNCGEIKDEIDTLEDNIPDKRTKEYKEWQKKINFLFEKYNKCCNFTAYKLINDGKTERKRENDTILSSDMEEKTP